MNITLLYDALEDDHKAEAEASGEKLPLVYESVSQSLDKLGHPVKLLAASARIRDLVSKIASDESDLIFNLCESLAGVSHHEQNVASLLELMGKRFTGAPAFGLALAQDKALSKKLFSFHSVPYPKFSIMNAGQVEWADNLEFPLFVKPLNQDASIGIDANSIVNDVKELMERISYITTEFRTAALVEEYVEGREIYAGVLGNEKPEVLPLLEWDFSKLPSDEPKIASSEAKWDKKSAGYKAPERFPDDIPEGVIERIKEAVVSTYQTLKLRDYARVDLRLVSPKGKSKSPDSWDFYVIEGNPNPHLDPKGELSLAAQKQGLSYPDLIDRIIQSAMQRPE